MRNMSFAFTTQQMRKRKKLVTRRLGWWFLKPGEIVCAVEKGQGLKKGEKVKRIRKIQIVETRPERLDLIDSWECELEGFKGTSPARFIQDFCKSHRGCRPDTIVNRIEFKFV